jgi:hypothetical protein
VALQEGETLKSVDEGRAASVFFEEEIQMILMIAMLAHDALGHGVPTHLSISAPYVVTLTVEPHLGNVVYPVTAGPAFEVGYSTVTVIKPSPVGEVRGDPTAGIEAIMFAGAPEVGGHQYDTWLQAN